MPERNEPCPCGSGRKYKKCCLARIVPDVRLPAAAPSPAHGLDERVVYRILDFGVTRFPLDVERIENSTFPSGGSAQIAAPWMAYCMPVEGRTLASWYAEARAVQLSTLEQRWLDAQASAWMSVWEVLTVDPGRGLVLEDLLTGERREVHEVSGSLTLKPRLGLLGRVVDFRGESLICGMHPKPLYPEDAAEIVREFKRELFGEDLDIARLRQFDAASLLIELWEEKLDELSRVEAPELQNTDGDPFLLTTDFYRFDDERREELLTRLMEVEGAKERHETEEEVIINVLRPGNRKHKSWDNTIIGTLICGTGELRAETNSIKRANLLRKRVETVARGLITWRIRNHVDPSSLEARKAVSPEPDSARMDLANDPEVQQLIRDEKTAHYLAWLDTKIPALEGRSPRKASRTAAGREDVVTFLKRIELTESGSAPETRFDVRTLYDALGIEYR